MYAVGLLALMRFESPGYLALFAVLPLLAVLSIRSLAGLGRMRRGLAILLRWAVVGCMILALAGAQRVKSTDDMSVVFVVDRSNSMPRGFLKDEALAFLKEASDNMRPDDRLGVIAFDGQSSVEQLPMGTLAIERLSEPVTPDQSDIAAALRMGMALFRADTVRRLVLLSDGNENVGEVAEEAKQYAAAGTPIDVVPVYYQHASEVILERLTAPPTAATEETINLQTVLRNESAAAVSGKIFLYHNDRLVDLDEGRKGAGYAVTLGPGPTRLTMPVPLRVAGAHRFRAVFEPDDGEQDTISANNEGQAFTVVSGQGRVLILTSGDANADDAGVRDEWQAAQVLARALEREQLVCDVEVAGGEPLNQVRLLQYAVVILSNVPAYQLGEEEHQALTVYVRDLGGGLVMVGGDESFGAGGWMGSPVEEVMPVSFDIKATKQIVKGALVLIMHACEIPRGNYWGERIAVAAVKTLSTRDLVGVQSYQWAGANQGYWVVPLQPVGDKTAVIQQIMRMQMGDMPDLHAPMQQAYDALIAAQGAAVKHMIVISDFDCRPPDKALLKKMRENKITCTTVVIGYGMHQDADTAKWIAEQTKQRGRGECYEVRDASQLPKIFIKESRIVRRSLINESPFTPRLASPLAPTVSGLVGEGLPELGGYVVTTAKPLAEVPLIRKTKEGDDPVLAHWQVGLGKTVAFTSGMWNTDWGANWAQWPKFSKLWAQIVRWASRQSEAAAFDVTTTVQGGLGKIRLDALDKNAAAIDFMTIDGTLVGPGPRFRSERLRLTQTGPGRYEGEFQARERGSYIISMAYQMGAGDEVVSGILQTGVSVAYSPEYADLQTNLPLLSDLAAQTRGRQLAAADAAKSFERAGLPAAELRRSVWEDLVRLMLLLFLLDVAVRRIAISPLELARKARRFIADMAGRRRPAEESAAVLSTLKGARERLQEDLRRPPSEAGPAPDRATRYEAQPDAKVTEDLTRALGGATEQDAPVVARPTRKKPSTSEGDYTARLLKAKRRARKDMDQEEH
ncbi:MAG: VWA domain-containing protein [Planctomycetes bacterium]|nr:VWA domain-containing protein [Planctomycetota bacterium]